MTSATRRTAAAAVCLLLAIVHTWPLALAPGRHSRNDNGDAQLNEWIMAWVAHQLPRDPAHLFEGNIFYPAHDSLAFSEPLIVPAVMGAPLAWAGASPVLVHNLVLIAGFALTAFAGLLLVEAWTGDMLAGLLTGSMIAFNTHTLTRTAQIQGVHLYGLPVALLATDRVIRSGSWKWAVLLAASMAIMGYTSGYLIVFGVVMVGIAVLVRTPEWRRDAKVVLSRLAGATAVAAAIVLPLSIPYARVAREQHMVRTLDVVKDYSATLKGYLATAGRVHFATWSGHFFREPIDSFFPGVVVLVMAATGVVLGLRRPAWRGRIWMLLAIGIAGVVLSLGPATPVYRWLFAIFPPLRGLRAAARFGILFLVAIAVLGGIGLALWKPRRAIVFALIVLANLESLRAPFDYRDFNGIPPVYRLLAHESGRVVLAEQPFYPREAVFENAPYVLNSTAHWRPLMNGYSGYTPETYQGYADAFWYFPEERAFAAMKAAGVTHVIVHPERFGERDAAKVIDAISNRADMELVGVSQGIRLYRLR
ncbi:MAG TPA: hypothetical protein VL484_19630 [Vicinamibacterales bacterium]|jgi:hypothetical protein|nr:hypothetical protein [Vicinamibacterales bacterium]